MESSSNFVDAYINILREEIKYKEKEVSKLKQGLKQDMQKLDKLLKQKEIK